LLRATRKKTQSVKHSRLQLGTVSYDPKYLLEPADPTSFIVEDINVTKALEYIKVLNST